MAFVRGADPVLPEARRGIAEWRRPSVKVIVRSARALVENTVSRTGVVGVIALQRNVARQVGTGVDHLEIANLAVDRQRSVGVIVLAVLRLKQGRRQTGERSVVVGICLGRKGALGIQALIGFSNQNVPIGRDLEAEFDASTSVIHRVEIVLDQRGVVVLAAVGLLVRRQFVAVTLVRQIVGAKVARQARKSRRLVVDVAAVMIGVNHRANRQFVLNDRQVDHGIERAVYRAANGAAEAPFDPAFELVVLGLVGDVPNHARLRATAEQRPLRPFEHFDALDISHIDVGVVRRELHRLIVEINRDVGEAADRACPLFAGKARRQPAHEDGARARPVVGEGDVGGVLQQIVEGGDVELAERIGAEGLDGQRHVLQRLVAAGRGHDDLANAPIGRLFIGRLGSSSLRSSLRKGGRRACPKHRDCDNRR